MLQYFGNRTKTCDWDLRLTLCQYDKCIIAQTYTLKISYIKQIITESFSCLYYTDCSASRNVYESVNVIILSFGFGFFIHIYRQVTELMS